jgi:hypothetical protein
LSKEADRMGRCPDEDHAAMQQAAPTASATPYRLREGLLGLALALALCAGLRLGLALDRRHAISKDGVYYMETARNLRDGNALETLRKSYAHPVYPVAVTSLHALLDRLSPAPDTPERWALAGMLVSLGGALIATVGLWLFAGLVYNWRVAWMTALVFSAGNNWVELGADALTDALGVGVQLWSGVLAILTLRALHRARARRGLTLAILSGLVGGLGFLVRLEAMILPVVGMVLWVMPRLRRPAPARRAWTAFSLCAVALLAVVVPYMVLMGQVTSKLYILRQVFPWLSGAAPARSTCVAASSGMDLLGVLRKLSAAEHPVLAVLTVACLIIWFVRRSPKPGQWPGPARPSPDGIFLVGLYALVLLPLVAVRGMMGGVSSRYLMVLACMLACPAAGLLASAGEALGRIIRPRCAWGARVAAMAPVVLIAAVLGAHAMQPDGQAFYKEAASCAAKNAVPGDRIMADDKRVLFYSDLPGYDLQFQILLAKLHGDEEPKTLDYWIRQSDSTLVALTNDTLDGKYPLLPGARAESQSGLLRELGVFSGPARRHRDRKSVHVYRVRRDTEGSQP